MSSETKVVEVRNQEVVGSIPIFGILYLYYSKVVKIGSFLYYKIQIINMSNELRIGIVGYSPPSRFDESEARRMLIDAYNKIESGFPDRQKSAVSGLTDTGVSSLAYREAVNREWRTVGIACKKAYGLEWFPVDEEPIIVGENWGDESQTFLDYIDVLIRVGGGNQSMREAAETKRRGKLVFEYELPKI